MFLFLPATEHWRDPTSSHVSLHRNYCLRARQPAAALAAVGRPTWWSPFLDWSSASVKRIQIAIGLLPVWPQKAWCSLWVGLAGGGPIQPKAVCDSLTYPMILWWLWDSDFILWLSQWQSHFSEHMATGSCGYLTLAPKDKGTSYAFSSEAHSKWLHLARDFSSFFPSLLTHLYIVSFPFVFHFHPQTILFFLTLSYTFP